MIGGPKLSSFKIEGPKLQLSQIFNKYCVIYIFLFFILKLNFLVFKRNDFAVEKIIRLPFAHV
jgi:hypothetical protein